MIPPEKRRRVFSVHVGLGVHGEDSGFRGCRPTVAFGRGVHSESVVAADWQMSIHEGEATVIRRPMAYALIAGVSVVLPGCGAATPPAGGATTPVAQAPSPSETVAPTTPEPVMTTTAPSAPTTAPPTTAPAVRPTTPAVGTTAARPAAPTASPAAVRVAPAAKERPSRGGVEMPATGRGALSGRVVVVDPGHNGVTVARINNRQVDAGGGRRKACNTSGTANSRMSEHELNWKVASLVVEQLRSRGATVWLTRPDDKGVGPCVDERAGIGNRVGADLVLSIHADGNTSASARGFHVIVAQSMKGGPEAQAQSQNVAGLVREQMKTTGMPVSTYLGRKGIHIRSDIAGVNLSEPPAVMLEMGNMRHPKDAALFAQAGFRERVATGLANAVQNALG